jgi:hypothetical protein
MNLRLLSWRTADSSLAFATVRNDMGKRIGMARIGTETGLGGQVVSLGSEWQPEESSPFHFLSSRTPALSAEESAGDAQ